MPVLKKTALIEDLSDGQFFQRYAFTREDKGEGILELRPAEADKLRSLRDHAVKTTATFSHSISDL